MSLTVATQDASDRRSSRRFSVSGLDSREELVLKSFIRLLAHKTHHVWQYAPLTAELCIVSDGSKRSRLPAQQVQQIQQILMLGTNPSNGLGYLQMPLHAHELEAELNRLGALIAPAEQTVQTLVNAPAAMPDKSLDTQPMRMLRWPPPALLKAPGRLRLATLMTGKQMTVYGLQLSSGSSLDECRAFFGELMSANLLVIAPPAQVLPPASAPSVAPASLAPLSAPTQIKVSTSLISRIRMRLGIHIGGPSNHKGGA